MKFRALTSREHDVTKWLVKSNLASVCVRRHHATSCKNPSTAADYIEIRGDLTRRICYDCRRRVRIRNVSRFAGPSSSSTRCDRVQFRENFKTLMPRLVAVAAVGLTAIFASTRTIR